MKLPSSKDRIQTWAQLDAREFVVCDTKHGAFERIHLAIQLDLIVVLAREFRLSIDRWRACATYAPPPPPPPPHTCLATRAHYFQRAATFSLPMSCVTREQVAWGRRKLLALALSLSGALDKFPCPAGQRRLCLSLIGSIGPFGCLLARVAVLHSLVVVVYIFSQKCDKISHPIGEQVSQQQQAIG